MQPARTSFETLEPRQLMAAQLNYADFSSTTGLVFNGVNGQPSVVANKLQLTSATNFEARSVWYNTVVPVKTFTTNFTFRENSDPMSADGMTFTIQNTDTSQLGDAGKYLGYSGIRNSAGVTFNFFNNGGFGSTQGFVHNGQVPANENDLSPVDLHSGDLFHGTITYDGHNMTVNLTDANHPTQKFSAKRVVDVPSLIGGSDTGYVGFTGSTGTNSSTQTLYSWSYEGNNGPEIDTAAAANPNPVTGTTTALTVTANDDLGEPDLKYTWSMVNGPRAVTFARANGTNDANSITASFTKDGTYNFKVTATDSVGLGASSLVNVVVQETATSIRIEPHKQTLKEGATQQYSATVIDQFGRAMRTQPTLTYTATGAGTISADGLLTASSTTFGHVTIGASGDDITGTVGATVLQTA